MTKPHVRQKSMSSLAETMVPGREWRIRGSGVQGQPDEAPLTYEVLRALRAIGADVRRQSSGSAANADSYQVQAELLDGQVVGETGNYWFGTRGCWIKGPRLLVLIATLLKRSLSDQLLGQLRTVDPNLDDFRAWLLGKSLPAEVAEGRTVFPLFRPSVVDAATIQAYRETEYRVLGDHGFSLTVGKPSAELVETHRRHGLECSAFITAWNPRSQQLSAGENERRDRDLVSLLSERSITSVEGIGQHPSGGRSEKSRLILGLPLIRAAVLGHRLEQNAIVWAGADGIPNLIVLR